jgi:hypothetical protein
MDRGTDGRGRSDGEALMPAVYLMLSLWLIEVAYLLITRRGRPFAILFRKEAIALAVWTAIAAISGVIWTVSSSLQQAP